MKICPPPPQYWGLNPKLVCARPVLSHTQPWPSLLFPTLEDMAPLTFPHWQPLHEVMWQFWSLVEWTSVRPPQVAQYHADGFMLCASLSTHCVVEGTPALRRSSAFTRNQQPSARHWECSSSEGHCRSPMLGQGEHP